MIKIPELETDDVTVTECDTFQIQTNARFHFDNIRFANNWREFLHLASEDSPCVDYGYPYNLNKCRDFDDEVGPVDMPGGYEWYNYDPDDPLQRPSERPRDMGADEFTNLHPGGYIYWWENVSVEGP